MSLDLAASVAYNHSRSLDDPDVLLLKDDRGDFRQQTSDFTKWRIRKGNIVLEKRLPALAVDTCIRMRKRPGEEDSPVPRSSSTGAVSEMIIRSYMGILPG